MKTQFACLNFVIINFYWKKQENEMRRLFIKNDIKTYESTVHGE